MILISLTNGLLNFELSGSLLCKGQMQYRHLESAIRWPPGSPLRFQLSPRQWSPKWTYPQWYKGSKTFIKKAKKMFSCIRWLNQTNMSMTISPFTHLVSQSASLNLVTHDWEASSNLSTFTNVEKSSSPPTLKSSMSISYSDTWDQFLKNAVSYN